jgi:hypothetical protein
MPAPRTGGSEKYDSWSTLKACWVEYHLAAAWMMLGISAIAMGPYPTFVAGELLMALAIQVAAQEGIAEIPLRLRDRRGDRSRGGSFSGLGPDRQRAEKRAVLPRGRHHG